MAFDRLSVVLLIVVHVSSVLSQIKSDPACITPARQEGFCVPIERCRNIYNIVKSPTPPSKGIQNYINRLACTLSNVVRSVCCVPQEIDPAMLSRTPVITTTSTTTPVSISRDIWRLLPTKACGFTVSLRIGHANATAPFEFPWMVLLRYKWNGVLVDGCGGSLINNRYVLTAAHCVQTQNNFMLSKVRLGEHDKTKEIDCIDLSYDEQYCATPPIEVDIESTVIHSEFNMPVRFRHDIALIRLAQEVAYSESISPICLPVKEDLRNIILENYTVTGWGTTEQELPSDVLLQALLKHLPARECQQKMQENGVRIDLSEEYQMCAGGEGLVDSCKGDSGGPLGSKMDRVGGRFVQYGIVSAGTNSCGRLRVPGIYTRVSSYMNWIAENMHS